MYVCICRGVTDTELKEAIANGHNTLDSLIEATDVMLGCTTCQPDIERLLMEANECSYQPIINLDIPVIKAF